MDVLERIDKSAEAALGVVRGLTPDQFEKQTPCSEWNVQALMNHMIDSMRFFAARATGTEPSSQPVSTASCEEAIQQLTEGINAAVGSWRQPGALERKVQAPFGEVPADFLANITASEMLVHSWDLAKATGQRYQPDDAVVRDILAGVHAFLTPDRRGAAFGPEQPAPTNASAVDQLAAFTGRQP